MNSQALTSIAERVIENSIDGILAYDNECRYTVWNSGMEKISGVNKRDVIGKGAFEVFPFLKVTGEDQYFYETLEGRPAASRDRPYDVPNSNRKGYFNGNYSPIFDSERNVIGGLAVIRNITEQKNTEIELRRSEEKLRNSNTVLESRVAARTKELRETEKDLRSQKNILEEKNIALREVLTQIELDKQKIKEDIKANLETLIIPSLDKFRFHGVPQTLINQLTKSLDEITSSFGHKVVTNKIKLTPREIEVCNLIKHGNSNKDIAGMLKISIHTVERHRRLARQKLGLTKSKTNLTTYLNSL